jgi:hypothetical protein
MYAQDAPFWYRGYATGNATLQQVNDTLQRFAVEHIIIGHTTVNQVTSFFNGKVIDVDTLHATGISEGLLLENGQLFRVDKTGRREALE